MSGLEIKPGDMIAHSSRWWAVAAIAQAMEQTGMAHSHSGVAGPSIGVEG